MKLKKLQLMRAIPNWSDVAPEGELVGFVASFSVFSPYLPDRWANAETLICREYAMSEEPEDLDLRELSDEDLVQQMHDDLYDGLDTEIE